MAKKPASTYKKYGDKKGTSLIGTGVMVKAAGAVTFNSARKKEGRDLISSGTSTKARATSVQGLVAKGRGGSAALGQHGIVAGSREISGFKRTMKGHRDGYADAIKNDRTFNTGETEPRGMVGVRGSRMSRGLRAWSMQDKEKRVRVRTEALERIKQKQSGGSAAFKGKRSDAGDTIKGGYGQPTVAGDAGQDRLGSATNKYRAGKAASANVKAGRNEKVAQAEITGAGATVIGGPAAVATVGVGLLLSSASHSKQARGERAQASRITARSNAIGKVHAKAATGSTFGGPPAGSGFAAANSTYHSHTGQDHGADGNGNHMRGTQNQANLKAIIAGRQARAAIKE